MYKRTLHITTIVIIIILSTFCATWAENSTSPQDTSGIAFTKSSQTLGNTLTFGLAIADADLDGDNDILIANYSDIGASRLWINDGNGHFTLQNQSFGSGQPAAHDVDLADLNGDLYPDIFLVNHNTESQIYFSNGNGSYYESAQKIGTVGDSPQTIQLIDVDGDGDRDAYIYNISAPNRIWVNDGQGYFTMKNVDYGGSNSNKQILADFNNDSFPDFYISMRTGPGQIWMNDGTGNFTNTGQALAGGGDAIDCGDLDGDGDTDIVTVNYSVGTVWLNQNNTGTFIAGPTFGEASLRCKLFDADLDGDYDLVTTPVDGGGKLWLNDGSGRLTFNNSILYNTRIFSVECKDIDGDNDIDVVFGQESNSGGNSIYLNESILSGIEQNISGSINFVLHNNYPNPFNPSTIIEYTLSESSEVSLKIFDVVGREIKTLVNRYMPGGFHTIVWNGKDKLERKVSTGIYYYRLMSNSYSETKKMILLE